MLFSSLFWQLSLVKLWILKTGERTQQKNFIDLLKLSSLFSFLNKVWNTTVFALTTIVYLPVLVFTINKHDVWKILIYEIQMKKKIIMWVALNESQCIDRALNIWKKPLSTSVYSTWNIYLWSWHKCDIFRSYIVHKTI